MNVTIQHTTVIDRGAHDSEHVKVTVSGGGSPLSLGIAYAGDGEGYSYRVWLKGRGPQHTLRYISGRRNGPILTPEVTQLVQAFEAAGWQADTDTDQQNVAFGITQVESLITLTPAARAQDAEDADAMIDAVINATVAALTGEAESRLAAERADRVRQMAEASACTITQEVIWSLVRPDDFALVAEHIIRTIPGVDPEEIHLYKLGPVVGRGPGKWVAYFSKHDGFRDQIIDTAYPLASHGGNRPARSDPPATHLDKKLRLVLAELKEQGWQEVERTEAETTKDRELFYTVTIRLEK